MISVENTLLLLLFFSNYLTSVAKQAKTARCCAYFSDYAHTSRIQWYLYLGVCTFVALQPTANFRKKWRVLIFGGVLIYGVLRYCQTGKKVEAFHVPRSIIGLHTPGTGRPWRPIIHQLQRRRKKRERTMFSVLGAEARRLMLPGPVVAAAHCKTHQKLEIFGNFVASRSAGPFVGRHFLLERHFAGEMISVGKARRCPFKVMAREDNRKSLRRITVK